MRVRNSIAIPHGLDFVPEWIVAPTDSRVHCVQHFTHHPCGIIRKFQPLRFCSSRELKAEEAAAGLAADAAGSVDVNLAADHFLGSIPNRRGS